MINKLENTSFNVLQNLIGLKLDHNIISTIEKNALAQLSHLQILNLGGNSIVDIERGSFNQNKKLQAIRLDANEIVDIVGLFSDLPSLRWLNISDNRIEKFDYFLMPRSLHWLYIHENKLQTISTKSIPDKIQTISLNCYNPT